MLTEFDEELPPIPIRDIPFPPDIAPTVSTSLIVRICSITCSEISAVSCSVQVSSVVRVAEICVLSMDGMNEVPFRNAPRTLTTSSKIARRSTGRR